MARVHQLMDRQPGSLPDIRMNIDGITFIMAPPGIPRGEQLVIRCDAHDEVWISIQPDDPSSDQC
jgi:hypothetical protein